MCVDAFSSSREKFSSKSCGDVGKSALKLSIFAYEGEWSVGQKRKQRTKAQLLPINRGLILNVHFSFSLMLVCVLIEGSVVLVYVLKAVC